MEGMYTVKINTGYYSIVIVPKCVFQYSVWGARKIMKNYLKIIPRQCSMCYNRSLNKMWGSEERISPGSWESGRGQQWWLFKAEQDFSIEDDEGAHFLPTKSIKLWQGLSFLGTEVYPCC